MRISEIENPYQDVNELLAQALAEMREERTQQRRAAAKKGVRKKQGDKKYRGPNSRLMPSTSKLGAWTRLHRVEQRMTMTELAAKAGITHSHLSLIESGQRDPGPNTIIDLARALGVSDTERDVMLVKAGYMPESMKERVLAMLGGDGHE